jgi:hypothetical protein
LAMARDSVLKNPDLLRCLVFCGYRGLPPLSPFPLSVKLTTQHPSSIEVKNSWTYTSTLSKCLHSLNLAFLQLPKNLTERDCWRVPGVVIC